MNLGLFYCEDCQRQFPYSIRTSSKSTTELPICPSCKRVVELTKEEFVLKQGVLKSMTANKIAKRQAEVVKLHSFIQEELTKEEGEINRSKVEEKTEQFKEIFLELVPDAKEFYEGLSKEKEGNYVGYLKSIALILFMLLSALSPHTPELPTEQEKTPNSHLSSEKTTIEFESEADEALTIEKGAYKEEDQESGHGGYDSVLDLIAEEKNQIIDAMVAAGELPFVKAFFVCKGIGVVKPNKTELVVPGLITHLDLFKERKWSMVLYMENLPKSGKVRIQYGGQARHITMDYEVAHDFKLDVKKFKAFGENSYGLFVANFSGMPDRPADMQARMYFNDILMATWDVDIS